MHGMCGGPRATEWRGVLTFEPGFRSPDGGYAQLAVASAAAVEALARCLGAALPEALRAPLMEWHGMGEVRVVQASGRVKGHPSRGLSPHLTQLDRAHESWHLLSCSQS